MVRIQSFLTNRLRSRCVALFVLSLSIALHSTKSECNVCAVDSNLACVSETDFRMCAGGAMSGAVFPCPNNTVCSMNGSCQPHGDDVIAPCAQCDLCDETNTFACKNAREFALCLGTAQGSAIVGECKVGYVCDINYRYICGAVSDGHTATCSPTTVTSPPEATSSSTTTTTTPSPSEQPTSYCNYVQQRGRFPVGTDQNTTCRQYLLCIERNGAWIGALYYCPNNVFFDDTSRTCTNSTPARCAGSVSRLSLYDINLY